MSEEGNTRNIDINKRLGTIIGILLNQSKIQTMTLGEKINYLSSLKYENQEIAEMLNTTPNLVAKEKSKAKKVKKSE